MTCRELVERVTDYLEGQMTPAEVELFEAHLRRCAPCAIYLEQMRITIRALTEIPAESISASRRALVLAAFAERDDV